MIQLSHLEQTVYFACQRRGVNLLNAAVVMRLVDVSRKHAINLLSSMARKGALYRFGRGRYVVIPPGLSGSSHGRATYRGTPTRRTGGSLRGRGKGVGIES